MCGSEPHKKNLLFSDGYKNHGAPEVICVKMAKQKNKWVHKSSHDYE